MCVQRTWVNRLSHEEGRNVWSRESFALVEKEERNSRYEKFQNRSFHHHRIFIKKIQISVYIGQSFVF